MICIHFRRKKWVSMIEDVKTKLEDDETMEFEGGPGDEHDPNNPFNRRGEKRGKRGKCKVVSSRSVIYQTP